jgi:hypothetical protein
MPDWNSHTNADAYTYAYSHTDPDTYTNAYADCNADSHTYTDAGADHAAGAWLQSARPANGGPLLEWAELGFHRHLSQRRVDCHRAGPRGFLYR